MTRHLSLLLIMLLVTGLTACGNKKEPPEPKAIPTVTGLPAAPQPPQEKSESGPEKGSGELPAPPGSSASPYPDPTEALPPTPYPEPTVE